MKRERRPSRLAVISAFCAVLGGGAAIFGFMTESSAFIAAWLASFYFWIGIPLGALALLLIHDLTGGAWIRTARAPLEAATATLPLFILFFLPVAACLPWLYPWAQPANIASLVNRWYLNPDFFLARAAFYFLIWSVFAALKLYRPRVLPQPLAGVGVIVVGFAVAYAAIDWVMSIEPHWFSSIYSMVAGANQFIAALSLVLLAVAIAGPRDGIDEASYRDDIANLATLLLCVVIFWAYASFCQFIIVWEENLSDEIGWYIERASGGWRGVIYAVALAQFFVPLVALVTTPLKRSRIIVGGTALLVLAADLVQVWWLVLPPFGRIGFDWLAPTVALFMGGAVGLVFDFGLRHRGVHLSRASTALGGLRRG